MLFSVSAFGGDDLQQAGSNFSCSCGQHSLASGEYPWLVKEIVDMLRRWSARREDRSRSATRGIALNWVCPSALGQSAARGDGGGSGLMKIQGGQGRGFIRFLKRRWQGGDTAKVLNSNI